MAYEVKTPVLRESIDCLRTVRTGLLNGGMELGTARALTASERALHGAIRADIHARLVAPKIAFLEAKKIEQSDEAKKLEAAREPEKGSGAVSWS